MDAAQPLKHLQKRPGEFSYPQFAEDQNIQVPVGFWEFWIVYYESGEKDRDVLKVHSKYDVYLQLCWKIFHRAEAEVEIIRQTHTTSKKTN